MSYTLNNRLIEITGIEFEVNEYAYCIEAKFEDNGELLDEKQIEQLNEKYASDFYLDAYEHMASRAYDMYKDRMKYGDE